MMDSGNLFASLILLKTVFSLGFGNEDIDFNRMSEIQVVGGGKMKTAGVIRLAYRYVEELLVLESDFHILHKPMLLANYDVLFPVESQLQDTGSVLPIGATIAANCNMSESAYSISLPPKLRICQSRRSELADFGGQ